MDGFRIFIISSFQGVDDCNIITKADENSYTSRYKLLGDVPIN